MKRFLRILKFIVSILFLFRDYLMKISISGAVIARAFGKLGNYVICYLYGRIQYMRRVWTEKRASKKKNLNTKEKAKKALFFFLNANAFIYLFTTITTNLNI